MPRIDIAAAKREALGVSEPITLVFGDREYEFPAAMPAEVELASMEVREELAKRGLSDSAEAPADLNERLVKAVYGEEVYAELRAARVPETDLMLAFGALMAAWMEAYQDPLLPKRILEAARAKSSLSVLPSAEPKPNSNGSSQSGGPSSKPTSNGNTGSTSGGSSGSSARPGAASLRSIPGSRARR